MLPGIQRREPYPLPYQTLTFVSHLYSDIICLDDKVERNVPSALPAFLSHMTPADAGSGSDPHTSGQPPRREIIWLPPPSTVSLSEIVQQTESFLSRLRSTSNAVPLPKHQIAPISASAHRCIGYQREEIFISSQIRNSYIVCHGTPSLQEICTICEERVQDSDVLRCNCGGEGIWGPPIENYVLV